MAVAPASMADKIEIFDDDSDGEHDPKPSTQVSRSSSQKNVKKLISPLKAQQIAPTHITQSPFASSKKESHVIKVENEKLFSEFVEYCTSLTEDCPEVISFLKTKHAKASPSFLTSVEFRNVLGRCLTRAQTNRSKTFVYINELCTVLRQHGVKKRQSLAKPETSTSKAAPFDQPKQGDKEGDDQPSTSGVNEDAETDKKAARKSRKQIAYLENLLKVYNEEIRRLQEADLSLDDLEAEDSLYIQEHKLKRKIMKIYEKLCQIKGCSTLTGRVLEQRINFNGSRYPEINKRVEKFINSPEARANAPDYLDILQVVLRANERHNLGLLRKQLNEIAKEAFRETASHIQDRRHLDLVYNFGSHLTDSYKPAQDPALENPSLLKRLRTNRELAMTRLDDVITKYSCKQEDTEEHERLKRSEKGKSSKESKKTQETKANGVAEEEDEHDEGEEGEDEDEEEDDDDEDDQSSDPDIEDEIEASTRLDGTEEASEEETNEAEEAEGAQIEDQDDEEDQDGEDQDQMPPSVSPSEPDEPSDLSPLSQQSKSLLTPQSTAASTPPESPSQSAPSDELRPLSNGTAESMSASHHEVSIIVINGNSGLDKASVTENGVSSVEKTTTSTSPIDLPRTTRSQKRKREESLSAEPKQTIISNSDADIALDMGVCDSPPPKSGAETPPYVSSSQLTPPPKKNKVNVGTQCDPQEVIVLSDSE